MKTQKLSKQTISPHAQRHLSPAQKKELADAARKEQEHVNDIAGQFRQLKELRTKEEMEARRALHDMLNQAIEWRELRFYRHTKDGNDYVDIIDRVSGEVLKTIPEPDFAKLANMFKQHPGITLDITS